ncbi:hypothetical protein AAG612_05740 [Citromicrobium bathyomarinum]|uniref:hypothetical protein n=1 Tax=Citromicrobium bathyomarinum TaxID=72174 RepID=UPI00315A10CC
MKIFSMIATAACAAMALATPALAQNVEREHIEAKNLARGKQQIAADRAYILVTGSARSQGVFYKTADEADLALFQEDWEEQYANAREKYEAKLERYLEQRERIREDKLYSGERLRDKPDEVSRETFSIGSVERRLLVGWGPNYVFDKSKDEAGEQVYSYLIELDPGEYTYYGPIFLNPNGGAVGSCMCMGSVKFDAKPGVVTNLGDFAMMRWIDDDAGRQSGINWDEFAKQREPARPIDYTVPAALAGYETIRADFRAAGKVDNWFGGTIARLAPMDGVLAYERDRIVDVKEATRLAAEAQKKAELAKAEREKAEAAAALAASPEGDTAIDEAGDVPAAQASTFTAEARAAD